MQFLLKRLSPAFLVVTGVVLFLALSIGLGYTRAPWWDEGFLAGPPSNLASKGVFGSHVLAAAIPGADRYLYWNMPLYFLVLTAWFKVFGFGVVIMRALSMVWALVVLWEWWVIMLRLINDRLAAALVVFLLSFDYVFILGAANGRMDMMTAACGLGGLAAYLVYRESSMKRAVLLGACGVAGAVFCHPLGLIYLGLFAFTVVFLDWRRVRLVHFALAAVPLILGAGLWALYIMQAPSVFAAQMSMYSRRTHLTFNPIELVRREIVGRYLMYYYNPAAPGAARFKFLSLPLYFAGVLIALSARSLRTTPKGILLICFAPFSALLLAVGDVIQFPQYFLHVFPFCLALMAAGSAYYWQIGKARPLVIVLLLAALVVNVGGLLVKIRQNEFGTLYDPVVNYIRPLMTADTQVDGPYELIFGLGDPHVTDGMKDEQYAAHRPEFIVIGRHFGFARVTEPKRYALVLKNSEYELYRRID
jgi:4-amino-4-deoxy-L-arabinose transferase-like glycosyltransferase